MRGGPISDPEFKMRQGQARATRSRLDLHSLKPSQAAQRGCSPRLIPSQAISPISIHGSKPTDHGWALGALHRAPDAPMLQMQATGGRRERQGSAEMMQPPSSSSISSTSQGSTRPAAVATLPGCPRWTICSLRVARRLLSPGRACSSIIGRWSLRVPPFGNAADVYGRSGSQGQQLGSSGYAM